MHFSSQARDLLALDDGCSLIVRVKQSSQTQGYVGGTTENLYHTCPSTSSGQTKKRITSYVGTEKKPRRFGGEKRRMTKIRLVTQHRLR